MGKCGEGMRPLQKYTRNRMVPLRSSDQRRTKTWGLRSQASKLPVIDSSHIGNKRPLKCPQQTHRTNTPATATAIRCTNVLGHIYCHRHCRMPHQIHKFIGAMVRDKRICHTKYRNDRKNEPIPTTQRISYFSFSSDEFFNSWLTIEKAYKRFERSSGNVALSPAYLLFESVAFWFRVTPGWFDGGSMQSHLCGAHVPLRKWFLPSN